MPRLRCLQSAFKHGVSEASIMAALENPVDTRDLPKANCYVSYGFDTNANIIEVGYDLEDGVVFHAMRAHNITNRVKGRRR